MNVSRAEDEAYRMDILILATRLNIGGPARQVLQLAKGLSREFRITLAAGTPPEAEGELSSPEVVVRRAPLVRPVRPATDFRAFYKVGSLIREARPRIVHTHMAKAGALGRLAALTTVARRRRPKLVHTYHGHVLSGYFGGAQQRAFLSLERKLARSTDALVAVSPEVRDELLELGVGRAAQYRVIELGLDLSPYLAVGTPAVKGRLRAALGLAPGCPLVGCFGRLVPIKDHATLLAALAQLEGVHLAVLGDGELRGELEALAQSFGLAGRAHFTGWWPDVPAALADVDVVVLASRNEGTPMALIEALAAARAVVATNVGGVGHVVQDGVTGWLCQPGDAVALAGSLRRALSERDLAAQLAARGRLAVTQHFGEERMLADHAALYSELLAGSHAGG